MRRSPPRPRPRESSAPRAPASPAPDRELERSRRQRAEVPAADRVRAVAALVDRGAVERDGAVPTGEEVDARAADHHAVRAADRAEAKGAAVVLHTLEPPPAHDLR